MVGFAALRLASKVIKIRWSSPQVDENRDLSFKFIVSLETIMASIEALMDERIVNEQINQVEEVLCQFLEWRLVVPTPSEFLKSLLFFSNTTYDFSDLLQICIDNILICTINY